MKNKTIVCKNCGLISEPIITTVPLSSGGSHKKASCSGCRKFIMFLAHGVPTLYFGKYKGMGVAEVARVDLPYLRWMDSQGIGSGRLKSAIREALACKR